MRAEKIILSFIAILVGLVAAGVAFYLYQMTKGAPAVKHKTLTVSISPTPPSDKNNFLSIDAPRDEEVVNQKMITIRGKTASDATVIVSTEDSDQVTKASGNGDFSLTQSIPDGTTIYRVTAIFPSGEEKGITQTVTYSTENF